MPVSESSFAGLALSVRIERWPIRGVFTTSRGSKTEAIVVVAEVTDGTHTGRGECLPYPRYGETPEGVVSLIESLTKRIAQGITRAAVQELLPAGAARNALDCALWDFEAKQTGIPVWKRAELPAPRPIRTAYTISLDTPEGMAVKVSESVSTHSFLKIKLGGDEHDEARLKAIRARAPRADIITDANESWRPEDLRERLALCEAYGVLVVEQPLPAQHDEALKGIKHTIIVCADESAHTSSDIPLLQGKYDAVNIKLDKTGGLTEALHMRAAARAAGMHIMVGCMVATSLSMAPAVLIAGDARFSDLDGALLLAKDREHGLLYEGDTVAPPEPTLWG